MTQPTTQHPPRTTWTQRSLLLLVLAACAPAGLLWLFYNPVEPWTVFLGRFHPVVLHLPIGVLGLVAMMETLNLLGRGRIRLGTRFPLFIGAAGAVAAMALGVLLMGGEAMEGDLVRSHLIWGIATAVLAVAALALRLWPHHDARRGVRRLYLATLFGACGVMTFASHLGASITHGETYLTDHLPWKAAAGLSDADRALAAAFLLPAEERRAYDHVIAPVFAGKCYDCHNTRSFKGKLVMDTPEGLLKGGATGPAIVPGSTDESLTLVRVHLPLADEEHMPPAGDPQLTDEEVRLITWWIEQGAPFEALIGDVEGHAEQAAAIDAVTTKLSAALQTAPDQDAHAAHRSPEDVADARRPLADAVTALQATHPGAVRYLDAQSAGLEIASFGRAWGDDDLAALQPVAPEVRRLVLPRSTLTARGAAVINQMPRLERLVLRDAAVDDTFVAALQLPHLRGLNLFSTGVTDGAVPALAGLSGLRTLYLGSTTMTAAAVERLRRRLPDCDIRHGAEGETEAEKKQGVPEPTRGDGSAPA